MPRARPTFVLAAFAVVSAFALVFLALRGREVGRADAAAPSPAHALEARSRGAETFHTPVAEGARSAADFAPAAVEAASEEAASELGEEPAPFTGIAGRAVLLDGGPAAHVLLEARARGRNRGRNFPVTTDDEGAFRFETLDAGDYGFRARTQHFLEAHGEAQSGMQDARVTLQGYAVGLRVLLPDGTPAHHGAIHAILRGVDGGSGEIVTNLRVDAEGLARLHSPMAASAELFAVAYSAPLRGRRGEVFVGPGTSTIVEEIRLLPNDARGALRFEVRCTSDGCTTPFSFHLLDALTGSSMGWYHSEDFGPDGVLHGLPSGEAEVRLSSRLREPPSFYPDPRRDNRQAQRVSLEEGRVASVSFVVPCVGRAALRVVRASDTRHASESTPERVDGVARATLTSLAGKVLRLSPIILHDDGGWTVASRFDLNRRRVVAEEIEPGVYRLSIELDGAEAWSGDVEIQACRMTEIEIRL